MAHLETTDELNLPTFYNVDQGGGIRQPDRFPAAPSAARR